MDTLLLLLVSRILVGAGWLMVHVALLLKAAGARGVKAWIRLLVLVPPLAPLVGLRLDARPLAYLWCVHGAAYLALWYAS
jgi:hypothetical protein